MQKPIFGKQFLAETYNETQNEPKHFLYASVLPSGAEIAAVNRTGKIRFSGARKSVLLKTSSGECCAPQNFVHLVTFRGTRVHLIVYLIVHQMKYLMER